MPEEPNTHTQTKTAVLPIAEELQKPRISPELPKRPKTSRCGGVTSAFSINETVKPQMFKSLDKLSMLGHQALKTGCVHRLQVNYDM